MRLLVRPWIKARPREGEKAAPDPPESENARKGSGNFSSEG